MKKSIILFVKITIPMLSLIILISLTGALITPVFGIDLSGFNMDDKQKNAMGLISMTIIQILPLLYIAYRSRLKRKHLFWLLAFIFFSINHLLNTMESLIFMRNIYPVAFQMVNLFNGAIVSTGLSAVIVFLWGSKEGDQKETGSILWSRRMILPWAGWILAWFVIYFCAGFLIPMNVEGVSEYYFGGNGAMDLSLVPIGYVMQIPRASIWIIMALLIQKSLKGSLGEKSFITGITFGCLMSSSLLVPNFLMPDIVRLAHLPEIMYANLLWGFIISWKTSRFVRNPKAEITSEAQ